MSNASLVAQAVAAVAPWLTMLAIAAWCVPLLLLGPPAYRLACRRPRHLDAIWGVLLLGVVNRMVSDFAAIPPDLQHVSATIIALLLAAVIWSYQRADS